MTPPPNLARWLKTASVFEDLARKANSQRVDRRFMSLMREPLYIPFATPETPAWKHYDDLLRMFVCYLSDKGIAGSSIGTYVSSIGWQLQVMGGRNNLAQYKRFRLLIKGKKRQERIMGKRV